MADAVSAGATKCLADPLLTSVNSVGVLLKMSSLHSWLGCLTGFACLFAVGALLCAVLPFLKFVRS